MKLKKIPAILAVVLFSVCGSVPAAGASNTLVLSVIDSGTPLDDKVGAHVYEAGRMIFARAGYDVKFVPMPFKRALHEAAVGMVDGVFGIYLTEERKQLFNYSDKIFDTDIVFFALKGSVPRYRTLTDLKDYAIGVLRGAANGAAFDNATYLNKTIVTEKVQSIRMLTSKRIDLFVDQRIYIQRLLTLNFPHFKDRIVALDPPLTSRGIYLAISKNIENHDRHVTNFNAGLSKVLADGSLAKIFADHGIELRRFESVK